MRSLLLAEAANLLGGKEEDLDLAGGYIVEKTGRRELLSLKDLVNKRQGTLIVEDYFKLPKSYPILEDANENLTIPPEEYRVHHTIAYNTTAVAVKVDKETGNVQVLKVVIAIDAGKVINPEAARTQIEGAIIMGMGYALTERFIVEQGINKTNSLGKCHIPKITMIPQKIVTIFVDSHDPTGPLGSKGVAETGILAIAPAITNAIYDATGLRIHALPVQKYLKKSGTLRKQV